MNKWLAAGIAVAAGFIIGSIVARIVRGVLSKDSRPEALQTMANPISSLFFAAAVIESSSAAI